MILLLAAKSRKMGMGKQRCRSPRAFRRRRNKILRESNFPEKSKFSSSNSFCAGCARVAGARTREPAGEVDYCLRLEVDYCRKEIPRERGTEVEGVTLIVVTSTPYALPLYSSLKFVQILFFELKITRSRIFTELFCVI